ncbi:MAG: hypothetical protein VX910_11205, partial [Candidatus Latescibacterota bacterium]|nr:hypothetical protein [Candidatus Latescibacterota bacterium]
MRRQEFRFSIDSVWALDHVAARSSDFRVQFTALAKGGALSIGQAWSGIEWYPHQECFVRDLQIGFGALDDLGLHSRTVVLRSSESDQWEPLLPHLDVGQLILTDGRGSGDTGIPVFDLSDFGNLALRAASQNFQAQRDVEKKLKSCERAVPLGEELWCPTESALDGFADWAENASQSFIYEIWDDQQIVWNEPPEKTSPPPGRIFREALQPGIWSDLTSVTASLLRAERVLAMASLMGNEVDERRDEIEALWKRHLEDLSGTYVGSGDDEKRLDLDASCKESQTRLNRLQTDVEYEIASSVPAGEGPDGIVSIVVFNPSAHVRSESVEVSVIYYGESRATDFDRYEFYRLVDEEGNVVSVEEIGGKQAETAEIKIRFVAFDVPGCGYKTYYLVPKPTQVPGQTAPVPIQAPGSMVPAFPEPSFAIDDVEELISEPRRGLRLSRVFQTELFSLAVDDVTGRIDLSDRVRETPLIEGLRVEGREDSLKSAPGSFDPTGRVFPLSVDRIDLIESGEVSARLLVSGRIASSRVELKLRLFAELPTIEIDVSVEWNDSLPMLLELCASFSEELDHGSYAVPFASRMWRADDSDLDAGRWVTAEGTSPGFCFSSERTKLRISHREIRSP